MQAGRRYTLSQLVNWGRKYILLFLIWNAIPVMLYELIGWKWLALPWQPISLIGIAVAFYLGFKNNSSYDRLWEGRKIWGGIVNASRTLTIMVRDFISNEYADTHRSEEELKLIHHRIVHRHVAWLIALTIQLRKVKDWEHKGKQDSNFRVALGTAFDEQQFDQLKPYISNEEFQYLQKKGNRASHIVSLQSKDFARLKMDGLLDEFRHYQLANMLKELYTLQGKSERIKNFPFPRQYATVNYYFACLFIVLLPFGMINAFSALEPHQLIWLSIPFGAVASWVFWTMEMIGDYSENPFEGLYNDVPITAMARGIEIDIRQMLEEEDLPTAIQPTGGMKILV